MGVRIKGLIVIDNLHTGGVATALYNYLRYASKFVDFDLLVFNEQTLNMDRIPENINILKPQRILKIFGMSQKEIKKDSIFLGCVRAVLVLLSRVFYGEVARLPVILFANKMEGYDLAISYAQDDSWKSLSKGCNDFVRYKVDAKYKAAFIHCDYANFGGYHPGQEKGFSAFDNIICVSESCKTNFISKFPKLAGKCVACENFTNISDIRIKAIDSIEYPNNSLNFVSVCRLGAEKGLSRTIDAFKKLYDERYHNFLWTIVGDGPEFNILKENIKKLGLQEKIILVGNKNNPYPYIKNASAFLLPSFNEAAPMVYSESAVLHVPVITTETCSANELIAKRNLGIVAENSESGILNCLRDVLHGNIDLKQYFIIDEEINKNAINQFHAFISEVEKGL